MLFWYCLSASIIHCLPSFLLSISFYFWASFKRSSLSTAAVICALSRLSCLIFSAINSLLFAAAYSSRALRMPVLNYKEFLVFNISSASRSSSRLIAYLSWSFSMKRSFYSCLGTILFAKYSSLSATSLRLLTWSAFLLMSSVNGI